MSELPPLEDYYLPEREMRFRVWNPIIRIIDFKCKDPRMPGYVRKSHYAADTANCLRDLFYKFRGVPDTNPISEEGKMAGRAGIQYEMSFKEDAKRAGVWAGEEVRGGTNEPNLSFRMDMLFDWDVVQYLYKKYKFSLDLVAPLPKTPDGMTIIPVEIKTVHPFAFQGGPQKEPKPWWGHYCQTQLYMGTGGYPIGLMVQINRETAERRAFILELDQELYERLVQRQKILDMYIEADTTPPGECNIEFGARGGLKFPDEERRGKLCNFLYLCKFKEINENGTKTEKAKMYAAVRKNIPVSMWSDYMREVLGDG